MLHLHNAFLVKRLHIVNPQALYSIFSDDQRKLTATMWRLIVVVASLPAQRRSMVVFPLQDWPSREELDSGP